MLTAVIPKNHLNEEENRVLILRNPAVDPSVNGCIPRVVCNPS